MPLGNEIRIYANAICRWAVCKCRDMQINSMSTDLLKACSNNTTNIHYFYISLKENDECKILSYSSLFINTNRYFNNDLFHFVLDWYRTLNIAVCFFSFGRLCDTPKSFWKIYLNLMKSLLFELINTCETLLNLGF